MRAGLCVVFCLFLSVRLSAQTDSTRFKLMQYEMKEMVRQEIEKEKQNLQRQMDVEVKKLELAEKEIRSSMNDYLKVGGFIIVLLTILGAGSFWWLYNQLMKKLRATLDEAFYRIDPRYMEIKIPASQMPKQMENLKKLDFKNLKTYERLDDTCTREAVIFMATNDDQAQVLKQFISGQNLEEREDVVFILFTKGERINPQIFAGYNNVTFANNHLTLVQALFVAARGMVR